MPRCSPLPCPPHRSLPYRCSLPHRCRRPHRPCLLSQHSRHTLMRVREMTLPFSFEALKSLPLRPLFPLLLAFRMATTLRPVPNNIPCPWHLCLLCARLVMASFSAVPPMFVVLRLLLLIKNRAVGPPRPQLLRLLLARPLPQGTPLRPTFLLDTLLLEPTWPMACSGYLLSVSPATLLFRLLIMRRHLSLLTRMRLLALTSRRPFSLRPRWIRSSALLRCLLLPRFHLRNNCHHLNAFKNAPVALCSPEPLPTFSLACISVTSRFCNLSTPSTWRG